MKYQENLRTIWRKSSTIRYKKLRNLSIYYYSNKWIILTTSIIHDATYDIFINVYQKEFDTIIKHLNKKTKILLLGDRPNSLLWYKELVKRGYLAYVCLI